jgi:hypothetical protein
VIERTGHWLPRLHPEAVAGAVRELERRA